MPHHFDRGVPAYCFPSPPPPPLTHAAHPTPRHTRPTQGSKRRKKALEAEGGAPTAGQGKRGKGSGAAKEEEQKKKTEELPPAPPATWVQVGGGVV